MQDQKTPIHVPFCGHLKSTLQSRIQASTRDIAWIQATTLYKGRKRNVGIAGRRGQVRPNMKPFVRACALGRAAAVLACSPGRAAVVRGCLLVDPYLFEPVWVVVQIPMPEDRGFAQRLGRGSKLLPNLVWIDRPIAQQFEQQKKACRTCSAL